jgi:hypothetical protein
VTIADGSGTVNGDGGHPVADGAYAYQVEEGSVTATGLIATGTYSEASVLLNGSGEIMAIVHGPVD